MISVAAVLMGVELLSHDIVTKDRSTLTERSVWFYTLKGLTTRFVLVASAIRERRAQWSRVEFDEARIDDAIANAPIDALATSKRDESDGYILTLTGWPPPYNFQSYLILLLKDRPCCCGDSCLILQTDTWFAEQRVQEGRLC